MGETKESFAALLRSLLVTEKDGIPVNSLQREYRNMVGTPIQYQAMGFQSLELLLKSMPEVCYLERNNNGQFNCKAVMGAKTSHIQILVAKTRTSKSRSKPKRRIRNFDNSVPFKRNSATRSFRQNNRENRPPILRRSPPKRYEQPPRFSRPNSYSRQDSSSSRQPAANNFNYPLTNSQNHGNQSSNTKGVTSSSQKQQQQKTQSFITTNHQNVPSNNSSSNSSNNSINLRKELSTASSADIPFVANSRVPTPYTPQSYSVVNRVITPEASISPEPPSPALVEAKTCRQMVENYAIIKDTVAKFKTLPVPRKKKPGKFYYLSTLSLLGQEYRSYPAEKDTEGEANEEAARIAVEELKLREIKALKVLPLTPCSSEEELSVMFQRILKIVEPKNNGIWHSNAQKEFEKLYEEKLPPSWLNMLREKHVLKVETITGDTEEVHRFILYPSSGERTTTPLSPLAVTESYLYAPELTYPEENQWDIYVCHVEEDSTNICIRLIEHAAEFEELADKMNEYFKNNRKPVNEITLGNFYCVEDENSFHRVRIENVQDNAVLCHFVDHGDYSLIDINNVFEIPKQFLELPCQAIHCELTGIEELYCDPKSIENLIELTHLKSFVAEVTNREEVISLILYDTSTEEDININKKILDMALTSSLMPSFPSFGVGEAYLTDVFDNGDIYLKPEGVGVRILHELINDNSQTFEECLQSTPLMQVSFSKMYISKKNDLWRRVLVSDLPKAGAQEVKVTYIDYGNTDTLPIQSLVEINSICDILVKLPAQILRCRMNEVPFAKEFQWTARAKSKLLQMVPDSELITVKVIPNLEATAQILPEVQIFKRNEKMELISINQTLASTPDIFDNTGSLEKNHVAPLKRPSSISLRSQRNSQSSLQSPSFLTSPSPLSTSFDISGGTLNLAPLVPIEIPPVGNFIDVIVQTAANPNTFFVHARSQLLDFSKLFNKMQEFYSSEENIFENNLDLIKPGLFYAVKNDQDELWYRGWVSQIVSYDPVFIVIYLVDYGEFIQQVEIKSIQTLYSQFRNIPMQAIKAKLAGVEAINGDYEINHITFFQELVQSKSFVAKIEAKELDNSIDLSTSVVTMTLIDTSTPDDLYISSLLVDKGYAKAIV